MERYPSPNPDSPAPETGPPMTHPATSIDTRTPLKRARSWRVIGGPSPAQTPWITLGKQTIGEIILGLTGHAAPESFETMNLLQATETDPHNTTPRRAVLDSGSDINLVAEEIVEELGVSTYPHTFQVQPIGSRGNLLELTRYVVLTWRRDIDDKEFDTRFHVVPRGWGGDFDFLLGRKWLQEANQAVGRRIALDEPLRNSRRSGITVVVSRSSSFSWRHSSAK